MADFDPTLRTVYKLPDMELANVKKNITYKTTGATELQMDVYYPPNFQNDRPLPAVLFVHGDGPAEMLRDAKDWGQYIAWGQLVAASGLVGVTFNHRSTNQLTAMAEVGSDIDDLIGYVRDEAASLNIDKERLGLWVASAGAAHGLSAALREKPAFIRCIVAYYGVMDWLPFHQFYPHIPEETLQQFSPLRYLATEPEKIAPMLVVKAALDRPQLNAVINQFVAEAVTKNVTLDLMTHPQGQHGFDVLDDNAISRAIIKRTLEFMSEYLGV
jgi:dipeptidyl aminopeptidase/acylaminoacyl peptidase